MDEILSSEDKKANNFYTILGCDPSSSVSGARQGWARECVSVSVSWGGGPLKGGR